jgi:hypothetical protein
MIKNIIIAVVLMLAAGGLVYKMVNPSNYKHPLHR